MNFGWGRSVRDDPASPAAVRRVTPAVHPPYMLANFKQVVKDNPIRIHPIVSQLVDPAGLEKMKVRPVGEAKATPKGT